MKNYFFISKFFELIKVAFMQRRKTLLNSLYNQSKLGLSKEMLTEAIQSVGLDERVRGEILSIQQFGELTKQISLKLSNEMN